MKVVPAYSLSQFFLMSSVIKTLLNAHPALLYFHDSRSRGEIEKMRTNRAQGELFEVVITDMFLKFWPVTVGCSRYGCAMTLVNRTYLNPPYSSAIRRTNVRFVVSTPNSPCARSLGENSMTVLHAWSAPWRWPPTDIMQPWRSAIATPTGIPFNDSRRQSPNLVNVPTSVRTIRGSSIHFGVNGSWKRMVFARFRTYRWRWLDALGDDTLNTSETSRRRRVYGASELDYQATLSIKGTRSSGRNKKRFQQSHVPRIAPLFGTHTGQLDISLSSLGGCCMGTRRLCVLGADLSVNWSL